MGKRVFLASPRDVEAERSAARNAIERFNESFAWESGVTFFGRGWEQTSSGVGRPQEKINDEILRDCDYLVLLLGSRWGSPPQVGDGYESGTEEEFDTTLELLADPAAPMRNVFIGFRGVVPEQSRDEQLERVLEFKDQLERGKNLLFKVFDSPERLSDMLSANLLEWARDTDPKKPVTVTLPAREALPTAAGHRTTADLTELATQMVAANRLTQAEELFNMAIVDSDPTAMLEYARFLRHAGRFNSALELNRSVIRRIALGNGVADRSLRAKALANIGIIQRTQGQAEDSARTLSEALEESLEIVEDPELQAYIRDNLALTYGRLGQPRRVAEQLRVSRTLREARGLPVPASGLVNEARELLRVKERIESLRLIDAALATSPDLKTTAQALAVRSRALYENTDYEAAAGAAQECLDANQQLGNADGIGIAEFGLALALVGAGRLEEANASAQSSLDRNLLSGNATGRASALWALAQVRRASGDFVESAQLGANAQRAANEAQNKPLALAIQKWIKTYASDQETVD